MVAELEPPNAFGPPSPASGPAPVAPGGFPEATPPPKAGHYFTIQPTMGTVGAAIVALAGWTFWQELGSRPGLFVCAAAAITLVLDIAWSLIATRRARVEVTAGPAGAYVGDRCTFTVAVKGPRHLLTLLADGDSAWATAVDAPGTATLTVVPTRRQLQRGLALVIGSGGLTGLVGCARETLVPLDWEFAVGPRPLSPTKPFPELFSAWGEGTTRPSATGDVVRGVRPYIAGDPVRRVHWPATARHGDLVVKEVEEPVHARLVLALHLSAGLRGLNAMGSRDSDEWAARRAAGYALEALHRGYDVVLATTVGGRQVTARVASGKEVNRRLAAASGPGAPWVPDPDDRTGLRGPNVMAGAVLLVTGQGDSWR